MCPPRTNFCGWVRFLPRFLLKRWALIRRSLHIDARCYPASDAPIARVAVAGGAYGEGYALAAQSGAQAFVVGEIRHHELLDAYARGLTVYDAGHFPTELPGVMSLYEPFSRMHSRASWPVKAHLYFQPPTRARYTSPLRASHEHKEVRMEQTELLWQYQQADMAADALRRKSDAINRLQLKNREFFWWNSKMPSSAWSEVAEMVDRGCDQGGHLPHGGAAFACKSA